MRFIKIFEEFISNFFINESKVSYSLEFKRVLMRMNNPIADELLKIEGQDKPVTNNYFDIKKGNNDAVSFITDRKYKEISSKMPYGKYDIRNFDILSPVEGNAKFYSHLDMEIPSKVIPIPIGEIGEIEKMWTSQTSRKTWVKFVPDNKEYDPIMTNITNLNKMWDDGVFFNQNRQETRIGRSVRSILTSIGIKFTDKEIEEFVNKWKSTVDQLNNIFSNFEVVSGDDIAKWYHYDTYESTDGQLGASCMRGADEEWFEIYTSNPKKVSLVIFKSPDGLDKIRGRSLLWTFDDGRRFMDRIYTNRDSDIDLFREYAKYNGWFCKAGNFSTNNLASFDPKGDSINLGNIDIKLDNHGSFDCYPYLDTFKNYNTPTGIITNDYAGRSGFILLEDTGGGFDRVDGEDGEDVDDDDPNEIYVPFYSRYYLEDNLTYCEWCDIPYLARGPGPEGVNIISGFRLDGDFFYSDYYGFNISNSLSDRVGSRCSITNEWRLDDDLKKIYSDPRSESNYIISDYNEIYPNETGKYFLSKYHDEYIPKDLAIKVWTSMDRLTHDWRVKNDKSWREIDGEKYDKATLIDKEMKKESLRWIKKFNQL